MRIRIALAVALTLLATLTPVVVAPRAHTAHALSTLRQDTVDRAWAALNNPRRYRLSPSGATYLSRPVTNSYNYLGSGTSNANLNEYNGYNGDAWCGWFAAAIWAGVNRPNPADYPRLPTSYPSSQAWRTDSGTRYHAFRQSVLPVAGDVLVWQNGAGTAGVSNGRTDGHVGVVVRVDATTKWVLTIQGNAQGAAGGHDSVVKKGYYWDADGPTIADKHFMGHVSRE